MEKFFFAPLQMFTEKYIFFDEMQFRYENGIKFQKLMEREKFFAWQRNSVKFFMTVKEFLLLKAPRHHLRSHPTFQGYKNLFLHEIKIAIERETFSSFLIR